MTDKHKATIEEAEKRHPHPKRGMRSLINIPAAPQPKEGANFVEYRNNAAVFSDGTVIEPPCGRGKTCIIFRQNGYEAAIIAEVYLCRILRTWSGVTMWEIDIEIS